MTTALDRKDFLRIVALGGAGLSLGLGLAPGTGETAPAADFSPLVWVKMHPDGRTTVVLNSSEMGQGVATSLPMMLADELDIPMSTVSFEFSPASKPYYNPVLNGLETDGSRTTPTMGPVMRKAGATARAMLVAAAAQGWNVDPKACATADGVVYGPAGQRAPYADLFAVAATLPVPADVALKTPDQLRIMGRRHARLDVLPKSTGRATYGIDVVVPGMKYASIAKPRQIGATVGSYDASAALKVPGVRKVVQVPQGVAVIADNTWAAFQGRKALTITWVDGPNAKVNTAQIYATAHELVKKPGVVQRQQGDVDAALAAGKAITASYESPYLAHATMEPLNATADVRADHVTIWTGTQNQTLAQKLASGITGIPIENIDVHTVFLGGGFGRRGYPDFVVDAVAVSKAAGMPVKVIWAREDDINNDRFRGGSAHALAGAVSADGKIAALRHTMASESHVHIELPFMMTKTGLDPLAGQGSTNHPYSIPNQLMSWHELSAYQTLPVGFWRAPYVNVNAFATESFIDELAHAAGQDPVAFRLANIPSDTKAYNVLRRVADRSKWSTPPPAGRARGVAVGTDAGGWIATVAEVSMPNGKLKVHRVWNSLDVGQPVNLDGLEQQIESANLFGLSAALIGKITFENGAPVQTNFDTYHVLKMLDSPEIFVDVVDSHEQSTGAGEIGTGFIMAAVTNAIFALTGKRIRTLPISDALV
ncbi:MAG: molybdopterin cofactor-binding domain-containing protein [Candidatus Lustribacter sp.]|jgi:isoquinoline 1-oxidoreductase beta subunit